MFSKFLIGSGILLIVAAVASIIWEVYKVMTESAGIGAVGGAIPVLFIFVGIILLVIGAIKFRRDKNSSKYS